MMLGAHVLLYSGDPEADWRLHCGEVAEAPWGSRTSIRLPSGGTLGLYQPRHSTALGLSRAL